jgi:hypothetical protein
MWKRRTPTSNSGTPLRVRIRVPSCIVLPDALFQSWLVLHLFLCVDQEQDMPIIFES